MLIVRIYIFILLLLQLLPSLMEHKVINQWRESGPTSSLAYKQPSLRGHYVRLKIDNDAVENFHCRSDNSPPLLSDYRWAEGLPNAFLFHFKAFAYERFDVLMERNGASYDDTFLYRVFTVSGCMFVNSQIMRTMKSLPFSVGSTVRVKEFHLIYGGWFISNRQRTVRVAKAEIFSKKLVWSMYIDRSCRPVFAQHAMLYTISESTFKELIPKNRPYAPVDWKFFKSCWPHTRFRTVVYCSW